VVLTLDVGCGQQKRGIIGIDIKRSTHADIIADVHNLPFKSHIFSKCYAYAVLEHVTNPKQAIREIRRILREHGCLEILLPKDSRLLSDYVSLILSFQLRHLWREYKAMKSGEHKWQYTNQSLQKLLHNFTVTKIYEPAQPFIIGRRVGKIFQKLHLLRHPHLIVCAMKVCHEHDLTKLPLGVC